MADVAVSVQQIVVGGLTQTYAGSLSTSDTYLVPNDGRTFLHLKKSGATDCVATFATPVTHGGLAVADPTATCPASTGDIMVGPFPPATYNNSAGKLAVTFSNITGLTMAALRL